MRHGPGGPTRDELLSGGVEFANEVAEGLHWFWWRRYQRVASDVASDPATSAVYYGSLTCE